MARKDISVQKPVPPAFMMQNTSAEVCPAPAVHGHHGIRAPANPVPAPPDHSHAALPDLAVQDIAASHREAGHGHGSYRYAAFVTWLRTLMAKREDVAPPPSPAPSALTAGTA